LKTSFPHLGNLYIPMQAFLAELGLEPLVPPFISARTITLGIKHSPEFVCFPFKVNLGNFLEAAEAGAECLLMVGGSGPCRLGYYAQIQKEIVKEAGFQGEFLVLEAPQSGYREFWSKVRRLAPRRPFSSLGKALQIFWQKARALERIDRQANRARPREKNPGSTTRLQERFYRLIAEADSMKKVDLLVERYLEELKAEMLPGWEFIPRITLLGEFYMVLEDRVNFRMERILGEMGVEARRQFYLTDWIREHLIYRLVKPDWRRKYKLLAAAYLQNEVGGHGLETVAGTVAAAINREDGVIHLAPFTCMPEIIAMQALPAISRDLAVPALSVIIDEHAAEAGLHTRLEAFVDLVRYHGNRRTAKQF
jgi:predicted nucleotide-binding protein (sugar kinase/HSP70/actin superfamily)